MIRHIIFLIGYIYFVYNDFKKKEISVIGIGIYAVISLLSIALIKEGMSMSKFIDMALSVCFGIIVYLFSIFSGEGIGVADGIFFIINGFLLTLKENVVLFLTGILVAFIIGIIVFIFKKGNKEETRIPFMPCFLPVIIGYILCIV